jgi:Eco29kI restriction endonuclease
VTNDDAYNPLDTTNLGKSVAEALLGRKAVALGGLPRFEGAGIYVLYYSGPFPAYGALSSRNSDGRFEAPIYIGKAIPKGARKGGTGRSSGPGRALHDRLREHADSVNAAANLDIADFHCRYLVVDDIWIPLGESLLIAKFAPIWNNIVEGFGNHAPGKGRHEGKRPIWDVLHPGREWALKCADRDETPGQIEAQVRAFLATTPIPVSTHFYVEQKRGDYRTGG